MKNKKETIENFHAVTFMREIRNKISNDIADLSKEQIIEYFRNNKPTVRILPGA